MQPVVLLLLLRFSARSHLHLLRYRMNSLKYQPFYHITKVVRQSSQWSPAPQHLKLYLQNVTVNGLYSSPTISACYNYKLCIFAYADGCLKDYK